MLFEEVIGVVLGCSVLSQAAVGVQIFRIHSRIEQIQRSTAIAVNQAKATAEFIEIKVNRLERLMLQTYQIEHPSHPEYDPNSDTEGLGSS